MSKRDDRVTALLKQLENGISDLRDSEKYKEYLRVMSRFHNYSVYNTLLILMQYPSATCVAGYKAWQTKFKRQVKKGETSIQIFSPMFFKKKKKNDEGEDEEEQIFGGYKISHVFDVSQTEGEELPSIVNELIGGNYSEAIRKVSGVVDCPIEYVEDLGGAKGQCNFSTIKVLKGMSEAQTLKTLLHETAHFLLHKDCSITKELAEVEAESVAYVVSNWLGLDTSDYSFGYLLGWGSKLSIEDYKETFKRISKCSKCIIEKIEGTN